MSGPLLPQPPPSLNVDISKGDEDPDERQLVVAFNDLLNGKLDPASAARLVDKVITGACEMGVAKYQEANVEERNTINTSGIGGWLKFLYIDLLAEGAMIVPADHPAQGNLVRVVQELNRLPRHRIPRVIADGSVDEKEVWMIIPEKDYDGFRQWLWELIEGGAKPYDKEYDTKYYINLSAFLARMFATGTAAMLGFCALLDPFARRSLVTVASSQDPAAYAFQVVAAAQWILHAGEAVRELCQRRVLAVKRWTPELWNSLRTKFDVVAGDERFTEEACGWAARARDRMIELEKQGSSSYDGISVVHVFRLDSPYTEGLPMLQ